MAIDTAQQPLAPATTEKRVDAPLAAHPVPSEYLSPEPLTPEQVAIVKSTAPVLKEHGKTITTLFYSKLLRENPALNNIFSTVSQQNGRQPAALAHSLMCYATYVDDLGQINEVVQRIIHKHVSLGVLPVHYAAVEAYLLPAIGEVLGDAITPEVLEAWTKAYRLLADIFIRAERTLYREHENWIGWRKFKIVRRQKESDSITSFYLAPADGVALPSFLPGQYVSLQIHIPELGYLQSRQYSLSQAPRKEGDVYRISVKREEAIMPVDIPTLVSNKLHDSFPEGSEVELSHPQGEFFIEPEDQGKTGAPLVLISAGVGATPLMSMLDAATQPGAARRPISWIYASRSRALQPFIEQVRSIRDANADRVSTRIFLKLLGSDDKHGVHYDFGGERLVLARTDRDKDLFVSDERAEYYVCGPELFMSDVRHGLEELGVPRERIHLELFSTGEVS